MTVPDTMEVPTNMQTDTVLEHLSREDLLRRIEDLEEEVLMSRAFNLADTGANDAILHWQGRSRFLSEKIIPVQLKPVREESLNPTQGAHRIIDGDNLAVMTSLLTEFRGGSTKGIDVIYRARGRPARRAWPRPLPSYFL
jgi:adenine-specific DNA-methyltransferase